MFAATVAVSPSGAVATVGVPPTTTATSDRGGVSGTSSRLLSNMMTTRDPRCLDLKLLEPESDGLMYTPSMSSHNSSGACLQNLAKTASAMPFFSVSFNALKSIAENW